MKVKMQGRIQKWVDHSISVTINLPNNVDEELVNRLYVEAWRSGCKGCTVYRERFACRRVAFCQEERRQERGRMPLQASSGNGSPPACARSRCGAFPEQQGEMGGVRRLLDGYPYEIFTGLQDDDEGIVLPKSVVRGRIIKNYDETA